MSQERCGSKADQETEHVLHLLFFEQVCQYGIASCLRCRLGRKY